MDKINDSIQIIQEAKQKFNPYWSLVGFSGGNDSLVLTHLMMERGLCDEVVHINTGVGIPQTHQFVHDTCEKHKWPLVSLHAEHDAGVKYLDLVLDKNPRIGGFPGPSQHKKMFDRLKERCLWVLKKKYREEKYKPLKSLFLFFAKEYSLRGNHSIAFSREHIDNLIKYQAGVSSINPDYFRTSKFMIATGIRQNESLIRMGYKDPFSQTKVAYWCNPLFNWTKQDCRDYIKEFDLEENEVSKKLGMSGECLCGAYAQPGELELIEIFYPEVAAEIRDMERQANEAGYPWGWEECRPAWFHKKLNGQGELFEFDDKLKKGRIGGKKGLVHILRQIDKLQKLYEDEPDEDKSMHLLDQVSILMARYDSLGGNLKGLAMAMPMCMNCEAKHHINKEQSPNHQPTLL